MEIESKSRQRHLLSSWAYSRLEPVPPHCQNRDVSPLHERPPPSTIFLFSARTNLLQVRFIVNCLGAHQLPVIRHPLQPYPGCTSEVWPRWKEGLLSRSYLRSDRAIFLTGPLAPSPWPHRSRQIRVVRCSRGPPGGHTACPLCSVSCASSTGPSQACRSYHFFRDADCSRAITRLSRDRYPSTILISNFFSLLSFFQRNCFLLPKFFARGTRPLRRWFLPIAFVSDLFSMYNVAVFIDRRWEGIQFILSFFFISTTYVTFPR